MSGVQMREALAYSTGEGSYLKQLCFTIPLIPMAKQGDRSRIVDQPSGNRFVHHYQPKKIKDYQRSVIELVKKHKPQTPIRGALTMDVTFRWPWLRSMPKKHINGTPIPKHTKPDIDNLLKLLCDCLQAAEFFCNDAQIVSVHARKYWADGGETVVRLIEV